MRNHTLVKGYAHTSFPDDTDTETIYICVEVSDAIFDKIENKAISARDDLKVILSRKGNVVLFVDRQRSGRNARFNGQRCQP